MQYLTLYSVFLMEFNIKNTNNLFEISKRNKYYINKKIN